MSKKTKQVKLRQGRTLREAIAVLPVGTKGLGVLIASVVVTGIAAFQALSLVRGDARLVFSAEGVDVRGLPPWLDAGSAKRLRAAAEIPAQIHALDRAPLQKLREYYLKNEWVASVENLEYILPGAEGGGGIVGRLRLREPMCVVCTEKGEYYFADTEGRRLGDALAEPPPAKLRLPVIKWATRIASRGEAWGPHRDDERVLHGFYMAALLNQAGLRAGLPHWVAWIDVRNVGRDEKSYEVMLITERGHEKRLVWGRTVRSEVVGKRVQEAPTSEKVERLRQILAGARVSDEEGPILLFEPLARLEAAGPCLSAARP